MAHVDASPRSPDHDVRDVAPARSIRVSAVRSSMTATASNPALPSVSVVVPTRQRMELLRRALASIVGPALRRNIEIVVVFDQEEPLDPGVETGPVRSIRLLAERACRRSGRRSQHRHPRGDRGLHRVLRRRRRVAARQASSARSTPHRSAPRPGGDRDRSHRSSTRTGRSTGSPSDDVDAARAAALAGPGDPPIARSWCDAHGDARRHRHRRRGDARAATARTTSGCSARPGRGPIRVVPAPLVRVYWHASSFFADRWP